MHYYNQARCLFELANIKYDDVNIEINDLWGIRLIKRIEDNEVGWQVGPGYLWVPYDLSEGWHRFTLCWLQTETGDRTYIALFIDGAFKNEITIQNTDNTVTPVRFFNDVCYVGCPANSVTGYAGMRANTYIGDIRFSSICRTPT